MVIGVEGDVEEVGGVKERDGDVTQVDGSGRGEPLSQQPPVREAEEADRSSVSIGRIRHSPPKSSATGIKSADVSATRIRRGEP